MADQASSERAIFESAIEKDSPTERAAYVDAACGRDPALRQEVEALLAVHDRLGRIASFAADCGCTTAVSAGDGSGTMIGPYRLLEQIGECGFGVVFMAEQLEPVRRKVALKVLKPGMESRQVLVRFEAERQALALMDHPNIAKVLDAGAAADGRPFFVMELVNGVPITRYCDERHLTPRQRPELFIPRTEEHTSELQS